MKNKKKAPALCAALILSLVSLTFSACGSSAQTEAFGDKTCTIAIDCTVLLDQMDHVKENKRDFVPSDGIILAETEVSFSEGESVYDVLYRVCRDKDIHIEASFTPLYNAYYVEGIHQLYEFDAGELSGWTYEVNGELPNYGCSQYEVGEGDVIKWHYTCDLGRDVGGDLDD